MGMKSLSSRAIIGEFYAQLEQNTGASWVPRVARMFTSNQESETYAWLGQVPQMREWVGGRQAKQLREFEYEIKNKRYEATLEVTLDEIRRDKTGQVAARIAELAQRANSHWAKLLTTLVINGESTTCYDGQFFFDTDHTEGDSGTQDNDLTNAIVAAASPTAAEMEAGILGNIEAIMGFKDDQGEPMNEDARSFLVMVPVPFMSSAAAAIGSTIIPESSAGRSNTIITLGNIGGFSVELAVNPRLTWTTKFATFRTDSPTSALIRQEEEGIMVDAIAEGSEEEFKHDRHLYGVKARRNVGYGYWQRACLRTFTTA